MFARHALRLSQKSYRTFSTSPNMTQKLRIGYIPEHFSTPIFFAQKQFQLDADLRPFPTGTGALTAALKSQESDGIDVAIGLTEGFVADLGKSKAAGKEAGFGLIGTYVESPLCWAISTGAKRSDVTQVSDLDGKRVGVSRIGSGSYVMSYVLADQHGWLSSSNPKPFEHVVLGDHKALRDGVNDKKAEFYMWEHFTTKKFWDSGELKRIGEIYTPWPSWLIVARDPTDKRLQDMAENLNMGVQYYRDHAEEAVEHITGTMEYSTDDAREWMKTVRYADDVRGIDPSIVDNTVAILRKAGVLDSQSGGSDEMIAIKRSSRATL